MCRHKTVNPNDRVWCGPDLGQCAMWPIFGVDMGRKYGGADTVISSSGLGCRAHSGLMCMGGSLPTSTQYCGDLRASLQTSKKTKVRSKSKKGQESLRPGSVHTWPSKSQSMEVQHGLYLCSSDRGEVEILDKRLGLHHKRPKRRLDLSQRSQFLEIIVELPFTNQAGLHEDLMTN